jgi:hypothetical protein
MGQQVNVYSKLKSLDEGVAKASFKRAIKLYVLYPKPSELTMNRLKIF